MLSYFFIFANKQTSTCCFNFHFFNYDRVGHLSLTLCRMYFNFCNYVLVSVTHFPTKLLFFFIDLKNSFQLRKLPICFIVANISQLLTCLLILFYSILNHAYILNFYLVKCMKPFFYGFWDLHFHRKVFLILRSLKNSLLI